MLDRAEDVYFLELNTIPGMTPRSVFTRQMERAGISQADIYNRIVQDALARSIHGR
jgi:D-alanine-D-alanine ligase